MNQNQQNSIFKEYAFSYIENQLNLPTASIPIEILKAIEDFIDDKIEYKQSLNIFSNFEISPNIISTINKIKNVNELPLIDTESEFNRKKKIMDRNRRHTPCGWCYSIWQYKLEDNF